MTQKDRNRFKRHSKLKMIKKTANKHHNELIDGCIMLRIIRCSQLQELLSSLMFFVQGYQRSCTLGFFWLLCFSHCIALHSLLIKSNTNLLVTVALIGSLKAFHSWDSLVKGWLFTNPLWAWRIGVLTSRGVKSSSHSVFTLIVTPLVFQTALAQLLMCWLRRNPSTKSRIMFQSCGITSESR